MNHATAGRRHFLAEAVERHPVMVAVAIYAASRLIVILGIGLADLVAVERIGPEYWHIGDWWYHRLLRWDAGWYRQIAISGYDVSADPKVGASIAFYPLLPLTGRYVALITGLGVDEALLVVGNLAGFVAAGLLAALVTGRFGPYVAIRSAAFMSLLPSSVFFSSAYTEALSLALVLSAFLALDRDRLWLAAIATGFATASRSVCTALVPIIMIHAAAVRPLPPVRRALVVAGLGAVAATGLVAFIAWQAWEYGDPLAFVKAQQAWSGATPLGTRLLRALLGRPLWPIDYGSALFLAYVALLVIGARRLPWTWTAYGALVLIIPYVSLATGKAGMTSMPRFVLMAFPAIVTLSLLLSGRRWLATALLAASAIGLFVTTATFSQWQWAG
jgi:hypothetical protein